MRIVKQPMTNSAASSPKRRSSAQDCAVLSGQGPDQTFVRRDLTLIFVVAALSRMLTLATLWDSPFFRIPVLDAKYYLDWARQLAEQGWTLQPVFFMNPGLPLLLGLWFKIVGPSVIAGTILQQMIGVLSCGLIYLLGLRWFSRQVALCAALGAVFYWPSYVYEATFSTVPLITGLNLGGLLLLTIAEARGSLLTYAVAAFCFGLSALCRPTILLFVALVGLWILARLRTRGFQALKYTAVFWACALLPVSGLSLRGYLMMGQSVVGTASFGMALFLGNHPEAPGTYAHMPFARPDPQFEEKDFVAEASRRLGRAVSAGEASQFWVQTALRFIMKEPRQWLAVLARKLLFLTHNYEVPGNFDAYLVREASPWLRLPWLTFGIIWPLGAVGIALIWRRLWDLGAPVLYIASYVCVCLGFFVLGEYRHPLVAPLLLFAGLAAGWLWDAIRAGRWVPAITSLVVVGIAVAWAHAPVIGIDRAYTHMNAGKVYLQAGLGDRAREEFRRAITANPSIAAPRVLLGELEASAGNLRAARTSFQAAVKIAPPSALTYAHLGFVCLSQGDLASAELAYRKAAELAPEEAKIHSELGFVLALQNKVPEAETSLQKASHLNPILAEPYRQYVKVLILERQGRAQEAEVLYRRVVAQWPMFSQLARPAFERGGPRPEKRF